ncbi:MAG: hypothetical protein ACETV1_08350 [Candidatus Bathyarchaeia archaeon]
MASIEAFNAAKNVVSMYGAFFKIVAQEIGMERALALRRKVGESFGPILAEMFKEPDLKKVAAKYEEMYKGFGLAKSNVETHKDSIQDSEMCI